jgi:hypothetical protein
MYPSKSLFGNDLGLGPRGELLTRSSLVSGAHGKQIVLPSIDTEAFHDGFGGSGQAYSTTPINGWLSRKGTTNAVDWTLTEGVAGGIVGKVGDTTASMAVSGIQLARGLNWKANMGGLRQLWRVKLGIITNIAVFIGFTDQVAALEMPIQSAASANTITTNATDACGFFFDTSMTADTWWTAGVKADVDTTHFNTTFAPVADTYAYFGIEVSALGAASFFYNGQQVGTTMANAVTATVALTPVIAAFNRTTANGATTIVTANLFNISGNRV